MTDTDRYITDEAVETAWVAWIRTISPGGGRQAQIEAIRAALPSILAQHRTDVLAEAKQWLVKEADDWQRRDPHTATIAKALAACMALELTSDGDA